MLAKVTKEDIQKARRSFSKKERDMIGKNVQGAMLITAAYLYRTSQYAPEDYKQLSADDGTVIDTTPLFPLRPLLLIGEMLKQGKKGISVLENFIEKNPNEIVEVLTGTNFRTGMSGYLLNDIVTSVFAGGEVNSTTVKKSSAALGNYFSTFLVPYAQVIDATRVAGYMDNDYLDNAEEPTLDKSASFLDNFSRPFRQRYSFNDDLPTREFVLAEKAERRRLGARLFTGLNFYNSDPEYARYLKSKGYNEFKLGAYSQSPQQKRIMNRNIREYLKAYVPRLQKEEERLRNEWARTPDSKKGNRTFDEYFDAVGMSQFEQDLSKFKTKIREKSSGQLDLEARAYIEFNKLPKSLKRRAIVVYENNVIQGKADMTDPETVLKVVKVAQKLQ